MTRRAIWLALLALAPGAALAQPPAIIAWSYTVQPGDTVAAIAARMGVTPDDLARTNGIGPDDRLAPGTTLQRPDPNMPRARPPRRVAPPQPTPQYRPAPTPRAAPTPPAPVARTQPAQRSYQPAQRPYQPAARPRSTFLPEPRPETGTPHLVWPTSGAVVSRFAADVRGRPNNGIDLAAYAGMIVRAAAPGRVIFAGTEPERFGQLIVIDHGGGWATAYAYLGKVVIKQGAVVTKGTPIARIGTSGEAKKPSLHFELRHDNVPRDPLRALPIRL